MFLFAVYIIYLSILKCYSTKRAEFSIVEGEKSTLKYLDSNESLAKKVEYVAKVPSFGYDYVSENNKYYFTKTEGDKISLIEGEPSTKKETSIYSREKTEVEKETEKNDSYYRLMFTYGGEVKYNNIDYKIIIQNNMKTIQTILFDAKNNTEIKVGDYGVIKPILIGNVLYFIGHVNDFNSGMYSHDLLNNKTVIHDDTVNEFIVNNDRIFYIKFNSSRGRVGDIPNYLKVLDIKSNVVEKIDFTNSVTNIYKYDNKMFVLTLNNFEEYKTYFKNLNPDNKEKFIRQVEIGEYDYKTNKFTYFYKGSIENEYKNSNVKIAFIGSNEQEHVLYNFSNNQVFIVLNKIKSSLTYSDYEIKNIESENYTRPYEEFYILNDDLIKLIKEKGTNEKSW